ncbi:MAG: glycosyl hydrolase family 18 protein [Caulobacteraceae bacterium]
MKRHAAIFAAILMFMANIAGFFSTVDASTTSKTANLPYEVELFSDVPESHWAFEDIHYFRYLNITQGIGDNKFGLGQQVKRSEFITMLVRLMNWELVKTDKSTFSDVGKDKWYHDYIETAVTKGAIIKESGRFNPDAYITREDIAKAIVRSLGYEELAKQLQYLPSQFKDVKENAEYINIAKDFGISNGLDGVSFLPKSTAKKEEAVAMLVRMYERLNGPIKELHAFYAIKAYDQVDLISGLNSVSFGWSRLEYDNSRKQFAVSAAKSDTSDFYIPDASSVPVDIAKQGNATVQLNLYASNDVKVLDANSNTNMGMVESLLSSNEAQNSVIQQIVQMLNNTPAGEKNLTFDGIVVDFENMRGEKLSKLYDEFLLKLKTELSQYNKKLYVAVHPKRAKGQAYYDGYDYKTIGEIADKVILMAHDYNATKLTEAEMSIGYNDTPLTPIDEVYYALKTITDKKTGVADTSKILLQISFDTVQWKMVDGKVINQNAYRPSYSQIKERLEKNDPGSDLVIKYSTKLESPWLTYHNTGDNTDNIIWYEDSRSVDAKIKLAKLFGVQGISLWRLGNIPAYDDANSSKLYLDVWQGIKNQMK